MTMVKKDMTKIRNRVIYDIIANQESVIKINHILNQIKDHYAFFGGEKDKNPKRLCVESQKRAIHRAVNILMDQGLIWYDVKKKGYYATDAYNIIFPKLDENYKLAKKQNLFCTQHDISRKQEITIFGLSEKKLTDLEKYMYQEILESMSEAYYNLIRLRNIALIREKFNLQLKYPFIEGPLSNIIKEIEKGRYSIKPKIPRFSTLKELSNANFSKSQLDEHKRLITLPLSIVFTNCLRESKFKTRHMKNKDGTKTWYDERTSEPAVFKDLL